MRGAICGWGFSASDWSRTDFLLCIWHSLGYITHLYATQLPLAFKKPLFLPCSYLSMGSEVPRSSKVPQMVEKFFWGCSVLLWDSACCGLSDLLLCSLLCASAGTTSKPSGAVGSSEGLSHQVSVRSCLYIYCNFELSSAAQFTWWFSKMSLWVVFPAWSRSASADWQEFFKICHLFCAGYFPGIGVWGSRASLR